MKVLAIDTTAATGFVAVLGNGKILAEKSYQPKSGHAESLLGSVDAALKSAGAKVEEMDVFAVAIGPGSFTGLRVGLATAKGFAFGAGKPLVAVSSLDALAWSSKGRGEGAIIPCIDAYRGEVFASVSGKEGVFTPEGLCDELLKTGKACFFAGSGAARYKDVFEKKLGDKFKACVLNCSPAAGVGRLALEKFKNGVVSDVASLVPNYIRKPDACLKAGMDSEQR